MGKGNKGVLRTKHKYSVGETINGMKIIALTQITKQEEKRGETTYKAYQCKCLKCDYETTKVESVLKMGTGCACCKRKVVVEHINSIVADEETHWMVDYFPGGWNEAKLYLKGSDKKVILKCPDCGKIKEKPTRISDLYKRRSIGCSCQDGISYPEKVGRELFPLLDKDCIYQYSPNWSQGKIYDFYLPNFNVIIELHGLQHYKTCGFMKPNPENDNYKEKIARENGIKYYFQVDCRESTYNWLRTNLEKITLFNWEEINWEQIFEKSEKNMVKEVCFTKQNNPTLSTKELCDKFNISPYAVRTYLIKGNQLGWCDYLPKDTPKKIEKTTGKALEVIKDGQVVKQYRSIMQCANHSEQDLGIKLSRKGISQVCLGEREEYKGYDFKIIE